MEKGYNVVQTAELLGLQARTVRAWIYEGKIEAKKLTGSRRWIIMENEIKRLRNEDEFAEHTE